MLLRFVSIVLVAFCWQLFADNAATVDSVTVDSVWNSVYTYYTGIGTQTQSTPSRDVIISFIPRLSSGAPFSAACRVMYSISLDSGVTWNVQPCSLVVVSYDAWYAMADTKKTVMARIIGGDRENIALRVTCRFTGCPDVQRFIGTSQLGGWHCDTVYDAYYNDPTSLQMIIDGSFERYTDNGLVDGISQRFTSNDGTKGCSMLLMNFGDTAKAQQMFFSMKQALSNPAAIFPLCGYSDSVAFYRKTFSGLSAFAHCDAYYLELSLTSYSSDSAAMPDGCLFLDRFKTFANACK
jgi:hypothetical protein